MYHVLYEDTLIPGSAEDRVDLSAIATELVGLYADLAEEQNRHLELAVQPGHEVIGNRHLLAQMISNLLDKHSNSPHPAVH